MRVIALATLLLLSAPGLAQERPQIYPTRDVSVTYRVSGSGAPQGNLPPLTMSWIAATQTVRMDIAGLGYVIADHRNGRGFMVMEAQRMVMDVPMQQAMQQFGPSPNATYRRTGTDTVAGVSCTVWSYQDGPSTGTACITADGVMLRGQGTRDGQSGTLEATQVTYGRQDPARFQRPQGFQTMQVPQAPGGPSGARPPAK
jgi:hypothetical protein